MSRRRILQRIGAMPTLIAATLLSLPTCSTGSSAIRGAELEVTVRDFRISLSSSIVTAGPVSFLVHDRGPSTHEFVVVRTDLHAARLPLHSDGITVDEDSPELHEVGEIPDLDIGDSARLASRLAPGRYVLFCNLEGHYLGGMYSPLWVRAEPGDPDAQTP